jgi:hypothetical protein
MFKTHDIGKRNSFFKDRGEHFWDFVNIPLNLPWFLVTCWVTYEDEKNGMESSESDTFCITDISQLKDISKKGNVVLKYVDLVSPNYMNETSRWKMEPLKEIWLCPSAEDPSLKEFSYILQNGKVYIDKLSPINDGEAFIKQKIFEINE